MFSLLTHKLQESITIEDREIKIDTRTMIALQCLEIASDVDIPLVIRIYEIISLICPALEKEFIDKNLSSLYEEIASFLSGFEKQNTSNNRKNKQLLSYEQDHALIVSAFRQSYNLSLNEIQNMHWWEFSALLASAPQDTRLCEVIKIRGMEVSSKDSTETRRAIIQAKQAVAIKKKKRIQSGIDIISSALSEED